MQVGDIVHYVSYGTPKGEFTSQCRAAIVTEIHGPETVSIAVINPTGVFFGTAASFSEHETGGTWHYKHSDTAYDEPIPTTMRVPEPGDPAGL